MTPKKSKAGRPRGERTKLVFSFGDVEILSDGVQWIFVHNGTRSYLTSLESAFQRVIKIHIHDQPQVIETVKEFRDLMRQAWTECKKLAASVERSHS